jgi:WD40 repeat protein
MSPVTDVLATISMAHHVELWEWPTSTLVWQSKAFAERPGEVAFSPDGRLLLAETNDRVVRAFDALTGQPAVEFGRHRDSVHRFAVSPDGRTVVTKGMHGRVNLHSDSGQFLFSLWTAIGGGDVAFSPDGRWLLMRNDIDEMHVLPWHP